MAERMRTRIAPSMRPLRVGAAAVLVAAAAAAGAAPPRRARTSFPVEYRPPRQEAYQRWYQGLRERRTLEKLSAALAFIRLPATLTLRTAECGEPNAIYDDEERAVTFCYEYVDELARDSAAAEARGFRRDDAVMGPVLFIYLHEVGHALFDLLHVPVLGREEDAADQVATLILLWAGPELATDTLATAAWMYAHGARTHPADENDLSDVHPLDAQRYYNILCLAYGSDPEAYAAAAGESRLPPERAEGCEGEYRQVADAARKLLAPHMDAKAFRRTPHSEWRRLRDPRRARR